jgi:hypothetical protein
MEPNKEEETTKTPLGFLVGVILLAFLYSLGSWTIVIHSIWNWFFASSFGFQISYGMVAVSYLLVDYAKNPHEAFMNDIEPPTSMFVFWYYYIGKPWIVLLLAWAIQINT